MKKVCFIKSKGFSIIEVVLSVSLLGLIVTGVLGAFLYAQQNNVTAGSRNRAVFLAEEGLEAVRSLRDNSFDRLTPGTYGLSSDLGYWSLVNEEDVQGSFTRQIVISEVDANRKKIISTVRWEENIQNKGSVSLMTHLNYWMITKDPPEV